jgi:hypothetical protein
MDAGAMAKEPSRDYTRVVQDQQLIAEEEVRQFPKEAILK